ncbi:tryptophan synthase subunit alpha [Vicingus serpentipes]|uniref:Tryptophan synthase alpha chain n=1 Tax=Vicingus serpentipes TaxID=1926625 RepID=A0A5C6RQT6_9FLAO|nr:tryptophan synthase subunit alpha [Vicingus serpentipes]TXB64304.1 tryptophan synthase subunit alpha [Vicingus serpentipes]
MSNRLENTFKEKQNILNVYITAGFPCLNDTVDIVKELVSSGVDMVEIGMPFSDPLADGPTIQYSSEIAIENGITLELIFKQVEEIRRSVQIPIILMGYYNQMLQYGVEQFVKKATQVGVDGLIIPDMPLNIYQQEYKKLFEKYDIKMSFLITPQTADERIIEIAKESSAFLYVVSSYAITGGKSEIQNYQTEYFKKIAALNITTPKLIGFGISNAETFEQACTYADGAIIGSAFIKALTDSENIKETIKQFITSIK